MDRNFFVRNYEHDSRYLDSLSQSIVVWQCRTDLWQAEETHHLLLHFQSWGFLKLFNKYFCAEQFLLLGELLSTLMPFSVPN